MTDIVERLRAMPSSLNDALRTMEQAADEIERLESALMSHWQPIETAPKDGTDIIVYRPIFDGTYIPQVGVDWWMTKGAYAPTWAKSRKNTPPTHWMPLPNGPGSSGYRRDNRAITGR